MNKVKRDRLEQQLVELAWQNPRFRRQLFEDPHAALRRWCGVDIPKSTRIKVFEETAHELCFVLRTGEAQIVSDDTLLDEDLDAVAGGSDGDTYTVDG